MQPYILRIVKATLSIFIGVCALTGCAVKHDWPAAADASVFPIDGVSKDAKLVLYVKKPHAQNFGEQLSSEERKVAKVLNVMALDKVVNNLLTKELSSNGLLVENISVELLQEADLLREELQGMEQDVKSGAVDPILLFGILKEIASLESKYLRQGDFAVTVSYGLSKNGRHVGARAELFNHLAGGNEAGCEDVVIVTLPSGLPEVDPLSNSDSIGLRAAKNFHLVKASLTDSIRTLVGVLANHMTGNSSIFNSSVDAGKLIRTDFVGFDDRYLERSSAIMKDDSSVLGFTVRKHEKLACKNKLITFSTSKKNLEISINQRRKSSSTEKSELQSRADKFRFEQDLRNRQVLYRRLGLDKY